MVPRMRPRHLLAGGLGVIAVRQRAGVERRRERLERLRTGVTVGRRCRRSVRTVAGVIFVFGVRALQHVLLDLRALIFRELEIIGELLHLPEVPAVLAREVSA